MSGYNNNGWNVYGLTDTYFYEEGAPFDTSTTKYYQTSLQDGGPSLDPISGFDADFSIQNPREYFLITLRIRASHIKEECILTIT